MTPGLSRAFYAECQGWRDSSNCTADYISTLPTRPQCEARLQIAGWTNDKTRGWLCPKCSATMKAAATRAKAKKA